MTSNGNRLCRNTKAVLGNLGIWVAKYQNALKEILSKGSFNDALPIVQSKIANKFPPIPEYAVNISEEKKKSLSSEQKQELNDISSVRIELKSILELILRTTLDEVVVSWKEITKFLFVVFSTSTCRPPLWKWKIQIYVQLTLFWTYLFNFQVEIFLIQQLCSIW